MLSRRGGVRLSCRGRIQDRRPVPASPFGIFGADLVAWLEARLNYAPANASVDPDVLTWTPAGAVVSAVTGAARITEDGTTGVHGATVAVTTPVDGRSITVRARVKDGTRGYLALGTSATEHTVWDLSALIVTSDAGTFVGKTAVLRTDGYLQLETTGSPASAANAVAYLSSDGSTVSYAGDGTSYADITVAEVIQVRVAGLADQTANGHDATQATPAQQPLLGPAAQGETLAAVFDGVSTTGQADTLFVDVGTGWGAGTSRTMGFLFNGRTGGSAYQTIFDSSGNRFICNLNDAGTGLVGFYDGAAKAVAPSTLGWQALFWVFDGASGLCTMYRLTSGGFAPIGVPTAYTPRFIAGIVSLGASYVGSNGAPVDLGSTVIVNRVATAPELAQLASYLQYVASQIGVVIA
jgi:hypothetical protein